MAQKPRAMCWSIVLPEEKHISSNAVDHWQQFLHQNHGSIILFADFKPSFNKNKVSTEFCYHITNIAGSLSECVTHVQKKASAYTVLVECYRHVYQIIC